MLSLYLYIQNRRTPAISASDFHSSKIRRDEQEGYPGLVLTGIGFGSLIFLTLWVFGDVTVLSRWTARPYPSHGPYPYPWR